jgi:uncharacterized protein YcbX
MQSSGVQLTGIYIYPVKSLRGIRLEHVTLENGRLPGDRLWILVDAIGHFMHQRDFPPLRVGDHVRIVNEQC